MMALLPCWLLPVKGLIAPIKDGQATCVWADIKPGTYAMACFHDENENGELDTNWLGIPREGTCASNNAKSFFGPPKWKDAKFAYRGGRFVQAIKVRY